MLCQKSDEVLFSCFVITLNATFESKLPFKTKAMTVAVKILTYPHHLEEPPRFTMFSVLKMCPLTHIQSCHTGQVPEDQTAHQYADA